MNVNITVRDFNYGYKQGTSFVGEKMIEKKGVGGEKGPDSIWEIIYWVVNSWTCIALFHNFWKVHFLHILCFKYQKLFVYRSVLGKQQAAGLVFYVYFFFFSSEMIWIWAAELFTSQLMMRNSVVACSCTELTLLSVGKKNLWLFKKRWKKMFGKKDVFLLVLLYIVYTNYYEY